MIGKALLCAKRTARRGLPAVIYDAAVVLNWRRRYRAGYAEEREHAALDRIVSAGDYVVDIGANRGQYSAALSRLVGPSGRVLAVEAVPDTFRLLKRILRGYGNVVLVNAAASDTAGEKRIAIYNDRAGALLSGRSAVADTAWDAGVSDYIRVPAVTLDSLVASRHTPLRFIKIDVEGHEPAVLRGAELAVRADRPVILCEIARLEEVWPIVADWSYRIAQYRDGRFVGPGDGTGSNYFLIPRERAIE